MRLKALDTVEFAGEHPTNPITGRLIHEYRQHFTVIDDVDGDLVPGTSLTPRLDHDIPMSALVRHNGAYLYPESGA